MNFEKICKNKITTITFATIALIVGFLFLNPSTTGNIVSTSEKFSGFLNLIGFGLILGAVVLGIYTLYTIKNEKKR